MQLKPIKSKEQYDQVLAQALQDGHTPLNPNIMVVNDNGEVVGCVSNLPTALIWMDSKKNKIRDTKQLHDLLVSQAACTGHGVLCIPCNPTSPYFSHLESFGFRTFGMYTFFVKGVV